MNKPNWKGIYMLLTLTFLQVVLWAQDGGTTTTKVEIDASGAGNWFSDYWMWIVGAIVFIILLLALLGGGSRSRSRTTVVREEPLSGTRTRTTTTTTDDDL